MMINAHRSNDGHSICIEFGSIFIWNIQAAAVIAPALGTIAFGLWGFRFVVIVVTAAYALSA